MKSIQLKFVILKDNGGKRRWTWGWQHLSFLFLCTNTINRRRAVTKEGLMWKVRLISLSGQWRHSHSNKSFRNCGFCMPTEVRKDGSEVLRSVSPTLVPSVWDLTKGTETTFFVETFFLFWIWNRLETWKLFMKQSLSKDSSSAGVIWCHSFKIVKILCVRT